MSKEAKLEVCSFQKKHEKKEADDSEIEPAEEKKVDDMEQAEDESDDKSLEMITKESLVQEAPKKRKFEEIEGDVNCQNMKKKRILEMKEAEYEEQKKLMPIWTRNPDDISQEEYSEFYKSLTSVLDDYIAVNHFGFEAPFQFRAMLFVPRHDQPIEKNPINKLYVGRICIMENNQDMLPEYLNFMKAVVNLENLPPNISWETLQQHKLLEIIRKMLVKQCLELFKELSENKEGYKKFYNQFSHNLKLGVRKDSTNRTKLIDLLRFHTSKSGDEFSSLSEYVDRMKENQNHIFFTICSKEDVCNLAFIERVKKIGFELIYITDSADLKIIQDLKEFEGKQFVFVDNEDEKLYDEDSEKIEVKNVANHSRDSHVSAQNDDITLIVPFNSRILHEGRRMSENVIVDVKSELFLELRGGGDCAEKMELDCDSWSQERVKYHKKEMYMDQHFKISRRGRGIRVIIKCGFVYYHFCVQVGTTIEEVLQKFELIYEKENHLKLVGTDFSLVHNSARLCDDDTIYAAGLYEFASDTRPRRSSNRSNSSRHRSRSPHQSRSPENGSRENMNPNSQNQDNMK